VAAVTPAEVDLEVAADTSAVEVAGISEVEAEATRAAAEVITEAVEATESKAAVDRSAVAKFTARMGARTPRAEGTGGADFSGIVRTETRRQERAVKLLDPEQRRAAIRKRRSRRSARLQTRSRATTLRFTTHGKIRRRNSAPRERGLHFREMHLQLARRLHAEIAW